MHPEGEEKEELTVENSMAEFSDFTGMNSESLWTQRHDSDVDFLMDSTPPPGTMLFLTVRGAGSTHHVDSRFVILSAVAFVCGETFLRL